MKFNTTKSNLMQAVQTVSRVAAARTTLPILGGILFAVKGDSLTVTATDIDTTIRSTVPVTVIEEGSAVLPARYVTEIVRYLPETMIYVETIENRTRFAYNGSELIINGFPAQHFPTAPATGGFASFQINQSTLKEMLRQVLFAISVDKTRPIFTGVLFELQDQCLRLVATDTYRLALRELRMEQGSTDFNNVIVPGNALNELLRIIGMGQEVINVDIGENHIHFSTKNVCLTSRLINGTFPAYRQIIPENFVCRLHLATKDLFEACERASLLTQKDVSVISFSLSTEGCVISLNTDVGWIREEHRAVVEGENLNVYFNVRYLIECLRAITTEEVQIELSGPLSAAVIRPYEQDDYLSLLLPARPVKEATSDEDEEYQ